MKGFHAALYKDLKLFLTGAGILALLLPLLLIPVLRLGMADLSGQSYVRPFPIAVRDLDGTLMSHSLISQMEEIQLFSRVDRLEDGDTDAQALERGVAGVVVIPQNFFYDLYSMKDCPVTLTLNSDMKLESGLLQAIFCSVMDIIRANQSAGLGAYTFAYGDLTDDQLWQMYGQSAGSLIQDALGRQLVFDTGVEAADLAGALGRRLLACVLGVLALFLALSAVKALPEEWSLGILPRFRAAGGGLAAFLTSKFLAAFLLTLPVLVLGAIVFRETDPVCLLLVDLLLLFAAFGLLSAVAAWTGSAMAAQRWGNLLLLASLALGGTLWPRTALPGPLPLLGRLTLPYYANLALEGSALGYHIPGVLALLWPLPVMGAAGLIVAVFGFRRGIRGGRSGAAAPSAAPAEEPVYAGGLSGLPARLGKLSLFKLQAMAGGIRGLAVLLVVAALCGFSAASVRAAGAGTLRLLVCDEDGSELSKELVEHLETADGVTVDLCTEDEGRYILLTAEAEGMLVIGDGYGDALASDGDIPLHYQGASSSYSIQGAREIVAGAVSAQRSRLRAIPKAEELMGRTLTAEERAELMDTISAIEADMPPLYHITLIGGGTPDMPFVPGQMSFATLTGLVICLTAACWCGGLDSRMVQSRMYTVPGGALLAYGSDCLALSALGTLSLLAVLLPAGEGVPIIPTIAYALCAAALALALARLTMLEGRVDALAPFLAIILCLLGGCFMDLSQLSSALNALSLLSPLGLAVRAADGALWAAGLLAAEAAVLFVLSFPRQRRHAVR